MIRLQDRIPLILHCASMSVAGFLPPSAATLDAIAAETARTATPWIGEHLAFISADGLNEDDAGSVAPTSLTYTVCPQLSEETVERVAENFAALQPRFPVPLILENSPQYFAVRAHHEHGAFTVSRGPAPDRLLWIDALSITSIHRCGLHAELERIRSNWSSRPISA